MAGLAIAGLWLSMQVPAGAETPTHQPNIVLILADDFSWNLVQYMPHLLQMQKEGITFSNYFVTDSLCCPSRSTIFTGRYPHSTGVFKNTGDDGGYAAFQKRGNDRATFATALSAVGYRTAMLGKYLNGYHPRSDPVAKGWSTWAVGGHAYPEFNYQLNENGRVVQYGDKATDYLTDVLAGLGARFVQQTAGHPFFIEIATFSPHAPYVPAPRDADAFPGLRAPRTPAFDAAPGTDAPEWVKWLPPLSPRDKVRIDAVYRKRAQSVLAIDKLIGDLQVAVSAVGQRSNTYFIFSSDNGLHLGEHRMMPGKMTPYDIDVHVPLVITGPGIPAGGTVPEYVQNTDLCPTFAELAHAPALDHVDGRSLASFLRGQPVSDWRTLVLVEHHGPHKDPADPDAPMARSGNPPSYEAIRTSNMLYVEYADGEREYHDLREDPNELRNTFASLSKERRDRLAAVVGSLRDCHDAMRCWPAERLTSNVDEK